MGKRVRHYIYRLDHDTGFAPHVAGGLCMLSGCKVSTIEAWQTVGKGSWIVGIGGNNTGKPDKLIYAMEVEERIPCIAFKRKYPAESRYLRRGRAGENVLVSTNFYYFGDKAVDLPEDLQHIIVRTQGCNRVYDCDVETLKAFLAVWHRPGITGKPNNIARVDRGCAGHEDRKFSAYMAGSGLNEKSARRICTTESERGC